MDIMNGRGRDRRRDQKRARDVIDAELSRESGAYVPPPREECKPIEWHTSIDDSATLRVSVWTWRHDGRLADFVILVEEGDWTTPDQWVPVSRIDCCMGRCHIHPPDRMSEHQYILRLDTIDDIERAFAAANSIADIVARNMRDRRP